MTLIGRLYNRVLSRAARHVRHAQALLPILADLDMVSLRHRFRESDPGSPLTLACCAEAVRRILGLHAHPAQLQATAAMARGQAVVQMMTGEGKTLVACMAACIAARGGQVHVITVNDYLAERDHRTMTGVAAYLGFSTGCIVGNSSAQARKAAYRSDILWTTATELGFDYLRDGMQWSGEDIVQGPLRFAILDEADSLLLDEARTPFVLAGPGSADRDELQRVSKVVARLGRHDVRTDRRGRTVSLTDAGQQKIEADLSPGQNLYDGTAASRRLVALIHQALRARFIWQRDVDYIVEDDAVVIVDRSTGRPLPGRRWPHGLHAAIEALEGVPIHVESRAVASLEHHALLRSYQCISGMTGTLGRDGPELSSVYGMAVKRIAPHRPLIRLDRADELYASQAERDQKLLHRVARETSRGRPVLIGVANVEAATRLSGLLARGDIRHAVLDATRHRDEAKIIAQAGRPGAVTVATAMAGRGTDILLGGNAEWMTHDMVGVGYDGNGLQAAVRASVERASDQVRKVGGLLVIGTTRHESVRVDDQLRGRAGRQGDPGESVFMLSPDDLPLAIHLKASPGGGRTVRHFARAQSRLEDRDRHARRIALQRDVVPDLQRRLMRDRRLLWLMDDAAVVQAVDGLILAAVTAGSKTAMGMDEVSFPLAEARDGADATSPARVVQSVQARIGLAWSTLDHGRIVQDCRSAILGACDSAWADHLERMDTLRDGIGLRAYARKDPNHEWNREVAVSFSVFEDELASRAIRALAKGAMQDLGQQAAASLVSLA